MVWCLSVETIVKLWYEPDRSLSQLKDAYVPLLIQKNLQIFNRAFLLSLEVSGFLLITSVTHAYETLRFLLFYRCHSLNINWTFNFIVKEVSLGPRTKNVPRLILNFVIDFGTRSNNIS